jgi:hypothetical protein
MPFGQALTERAVSVSDRPKFESPFLQLTAERPEAIIRILDEDVTTYWRYWMPVNLGDKWDGRPVIVGKNSPISQYMNTLDKQDPKRKTPVLRAYINVLDRTVVDGQPLNKVKIWDVGSDVVKSLQVFDGRQYNRRTMEKMRLQEFDIMLVRVPTRGQDGKERFTTVPSPSFNDEPLSEDLLVLPRYDLRKMVEPMPDDAQRALLGGAKYQDVRDSLGWTGVYPMYTPNEEVPF